MPPSAPAAVERDDHVAARMREARRQSGGLAEVAIKIDDAEVLVDAADRA